MGGRRTDADSSDPRGVGTPAQEELDFEAALEGLEALVAELERGELPLEEALSAFEKGVALVRRCAGQLEQAERRVDELVREGERWIARPFEEPEAKD